MELYKIKIVAMIGLTLVVLARPLDSMTDISLELQFSENTKPLSR